MQEIFEEPRAYTLRGFLSEAEAQHFIDIARSRLQRANVSGDEHGYISNGRTGKNCWVKHSESEITLNVAQRIAMQVNMPLANAESFQIIYYEKEQQYYNHLDAWKHDGSEKSRRCMAKGGQRMVTALVYLNNVEEGGDTVFTRHCVRVNPELGKLLVFYNCHKGTNMVHPLSEHTGAPVLRGEKYAFNLWFREYPVVQEMADSYFITPTSLPIATLVRLENISPIAHDPGPSQRASTWLKSLPGWADSLELPEALLKCKRESPQLTIYKPGAIHRDFHDAYLLDQEPGATYVKSGGQRVWTVMILTQGSCQIAFRGYGKKTLHAGDVLLIKNTLDDSAVRNDDVRKTITTENGCQIINLWFRRRLDELKALKEQTDFLRYCQYVKEHASRPPPDGPISYATYSPKDFDIALVRQLDSEPNLIHEIKTIDSDCPVYQVSNILTPSSLRIVQDYIRHGIDKGIFSLGDRQAQRYKIRDDIVSRIVQYYLQPVIEAAVGRHLVPTYTYLSAYIDGADLPPHTDNPDCQFTVSFVVNKTPTELYYPIYIDKTRQAVKYRGRYDSCPDKMGAIEIDCPVNDAMIFSGIDHIHWRERLNGQYTTLLLHYIVRPELSP